MKTSLSPEEDKGSGISVNRADAVQGRPCVVSEPWHYRGHRYFIFGAFKAEGD